ncbi:MAG TPA: DUF3352 domain-containing protein [Candidatus Limnocylindria bacterium]|nr:DUF3352 domain-containing protein [Candidatus Limnocylindria bacterium]
MSDRQPSGFNDLSASQDDTSTKVESTELFSHVRAPAGTVVAETPPPAATPSGGTGPVGGPMTMNSRWRWAVVGVATILVVGLLGAAFVLSQPKSGAPSTVARYAPSGTAFLVELHQDLPGDQHNLLAQFMSHFPGFADQAAFDQKIDETFESLLAHQDAPISWEQDIKPWFGGQIGVFSAHVNPSFGTPPSTTVALTIKSGQRAALEAWLTPMLGSWSQNDYEGQTIWSGRFPDSHDLLTLAWSDEALLMSTRIEDLEAALDVRADRSLGLADDSYFLQQLAGLHADRLGTFYFDGRVIAQEMRDQGTYEQGFPPGGALGGLGATDAIIDAIAIRTLGEIRAEGDHLALTTRAERPANSNLPPASANRSTDLAELAPGDSLFYAEVRDVGQTIGFYVEQSLLPVASAGGAPIDLSGIQQMLGVPPQDFFDFVVDASVSVSGSAIAPEVGLVATVDDNAIATARVNKIVGLLRAAMQFGGGVTIGTEQHGAATLTVITLESGMAGAPETSVAVSVTGGRLLIGTHDFVIGILDRTRDQSLAARADYQAAIAAGGAANAGVVFVDIGAAISAYHTVVPMLLGEGSTEYELNQKPFLVPLSHLAVVTTTDNGQQVQHMFLYVK